MSAYGSFAAVGEVVEETGRKRSAFRAVGLFLSVCAVLGVVATVHNVKTVQTKQTGVVDAAREIVDCQCLGICNTPDDSHLGNWCYVNKEISPCMDSTGRTVYGQSWAHCEVIYGEDDCLSNPCKNSAICVDRYDSYDCVCRPGWRGTDCSTRVNVNYAVTLTTSDASDSGTENAVFLQFVGAEGDTTAEQVVFLKGVGRSTEKRATVMAADVGTLHKIVYRVGGDDNLEPAIIHVDFKGDTFVAVGQLPASDMSTTQSVKLVKGTKYTIDITTADSPNWAATLNDVYVQFTGTNWEVSGAVVMLPGGIKDGVTKSVDIYAADVGTPAKITYWTRSDDSMLPSSILVNGRYKASSTTGDRCIVDKDGKATFLGDTDDGRGFAYTDATCKVDETENACTGTEGCRFCVLFDPKAELDQLLCPWTLPYSDGRYIVVDLVDTEGEEAEGEEAADAVEAEADDVVDEVADDVQDAAE